MNKKILILVGITCIILLSLPFFNCGGGFKSDSPNAIQFEKTIFGEDTLK